MSVIPKMKRLNSNTQTIIHTVSTKQRIRKIIWNRKTETKESFKDNPEKDLLNFKARRSFLMNQTTSTASTLSTATLSTATLSTATLSTAIPITNSLSTVLTIPLGILLTAAMLIGLCGNFIVCWIVFRKPAMRSSTNLLLANLALSDIMLCVVGMPAYFFGYLTRHDWLLEDIFYEIVGFTQAFLISTGNCILLSISLDRYLVIIYKKDKLDTKRVKKLILLSWMYSFVITCCPLIGWGTYVLLPARTNIVMTNDAYQSSNTAFIVFVCTMALFLPVIVMTYFYVCIISSVKRNGVKVHNDSREVHFQYHSNRSINTGSAWIRRLITVDVSFKTRSFKTIFILFLLIVVCWVPFCVAVIVHTFYRYTYGTEILVFLLWLGFLKSALNPVVYSIRINKFRTYCKKALPGNLNKLCGLSNMARRRINPSVNYECPDLATINVENVTTCISTSQNVNRSTSDTFLCSSQSSL